MENLVIRGFLAWLRAWRTEGRTVAQQLGERMERLRLARELHDTLLQGLNVLILRLHVEIEGLPPEHPQRERLVQVRLEVERLLEECQHAVTMLRATPAGSPDLLSQLQALTREAIARSTGAVSVRATGDPRPLRQSVAEQMRLICREALVNATKHANSASKTVTIAYSDRGFDLVVEDDGKGAAKHSSRVHGSTKLGLLGMQERAAQIGASLQLTQHAHGGLRVGIHVPAKSAFATQEPLPRATGWRLVAARKDPATIT